MVLGAPALPAVARKARGRQEATVISNAIQLISFMRVAARAAILALHLPLAVLVGRSSRGLVAQGALVLTVDQVTPARKAAAVARVATLGPAGLVALLVLMAARVQAGAEVAVPVRPLELEKLAAAAAALAYLARVRMALRASLMVAAVVVVPVVVLDSLVQAVVLRLLVAVGFTGVVGLVLEITSTLLECILL